jgi:hypothetical protein
MPDSGWSLRLKFSLCLGLGNVKLVFAGLGAGTVRAGSNSDADTCKPRDTRLPRDKHMDKRAFIMIFCCCYQWLLEKHARPDSDAH